MRTSAAAPCEGGFGGWMRVTLLYFAAARERAGVPRETVELRQGATAGDARRHPSPDRYARTWRALRGDRRRVSTPRRRVFRLPPRDRGTEEGRAHLEARALRGRFRVGRDGKLKRPFQCQGGVRSFAHDERTSHGESTLRSPRA